MLYIYNGIRLFVYFDIVLLDRSNGRRGATLL